jgi:hypothetical protein
VRHRRARDHDLLRRAPLRPSLRARLSRTFNGIRHRRRRIDGEQRAEHRAIRREPDERAVAAREQLPVEAPGIVTRAVRAIFREFARDAAGARQMRAGRATAHRPPRGPPYAAHGLEQRAVRPDRHR